MRHARSLFLHPVPGFSLARPQIFILSVANFDLSCLCIYALAVSPSKRELKGPTTLPLTHTGTL